MYLFGVDYADCYGIIHINDGKSTLFIPKLSDEHKIWMKVKD